ncbi:tyrosine-type recombinase/integrase [Sphingomonas adhaesiva]|uniref:tyrosine-type recombinase/integrase n=1 Tax=Sphingomonas adhaesiva TaxID=28212 RepID=UPI002FF94752
MEAGMTRAIHKLTSRKVDTVKTPGWHGDGGGLWLRVENSGAKRWVFAWERNKRRREMGLGSVLDTSLAKARQQAADARVLLAEGVDPLDARRTEEEAEQDRARAAEAQAKKSANEALFGVFADRYIDTHEAGWKNAKHRQQWRNTIKTHAKSILDKKVDEVTPDDVVAILQPIWTRLPETAGRLRGRIENILDAARVSKLIASPWENPARWRGNLIHLLPRRPKKSQVKHHAAIPYDQLPAFYEALRKRSALAARALELTTLCATRTNETLQMRWGEVDLDTAVWTIPAERMKMGMLHRIPLSPAAVALLADLAERPNECPDAFVFEGQKLGTPLSQMSMTMLLRRMGYGQYTVHGMRSCFSDYMNDCTNHHQVIIEQALAHLVGSEVSRAYRRGDAFNKRRTMMKDWEEYLVGHGAGAKNAEELPVAA